ncbi:MAG: DUF1735 domain-containing protein [Mucilaginibacter polytrichastri]|nr:DUF1735 domain-containing protein [Mucilaginibacter polytrichastri]
MLLQISAPLPLAFSGMQINIELMMKNIIKTSLVLSIALFSSCLKDDSANLTPDNSPAVVEFSTITDIPASPVGSVYPLYVRAYELAPSVDMPLTVNYTGGKSAPEDITVNLAVKAGAVTSYNDEQHTEYEDLPTDMYTLPATVTIPKGQRKANIIVKIAIDKFDLSKSYILPVSITSASSANVSSNYGTILVSINAKNQYDGEYEATGTLVDQAAATITGRYPTSYYLITQTANSVAMFDFGYSGQFGHQINSNGGQSYYGNFAPVFTINADGTISSVVNYYGQPSPGPQFRAARIDVSGINKYTDANGVKKLEVSYVMTQGGADRTFFKEVLTYKGPRP